MNGYFPTFRAMKTREDAAGIKAELKDVADLDSLRGKFNVKIFGRKIPIPQTGFWYDLPELAAFTAVIAISCTYAIWVASVVAAKPGFTFAPGYS
jgi:hypothetical protein